MPLDGGSGVDAFEKLVATELRCLTRQDTAAFGCGCGGGKDRRPRNHHRGDHRARMIFTSSSRPRHGQRPARRTRNRSRCMWSPSRRRWSRARRRWSRARRRCRPRRSQGRSRRKYRSSRRVRTVLGRGGSTCFTCRFTVERTAMRWLLEAASIPAAAMPRDENWTNRRPPGCECCDCSQLAVRNYSPGMLRD